LYAPFQPSDDGEKGAGEKGRRRLNIRQNMGLIKSLKWVRMKGPTTQFRGYDVRSVTTLQEDRVFIVSHRLCRALVSTESGVKEGRMHTGAE
jgi:hypothetical protein